MNLGFSSRELNSHANIIEPICSNIYEYDWHTLGDNLIPFFFKALLKKDGNRYPSSSIISLLNGAQRILHAHQKRVWREKDKASIDSVSPLEACEPVFNIKSNPLFMRTISCILQSMKQSIKEGANKPHRKVNIFSLEDERLMLNHTCHQLHSPQGLAKCFAYYYCRTFLICRQRELFNLKIQMFFLRWSMMVILVLGKFVSCCFCLILFFFLNTYYIAH